MAGTAESSLSKTVSSKHIQSAMRLKTLEAHLHGHTSSNYTTPPIHSKTTSPIGDQVFKCSKIWGRGSSQSRHYMMPADLQTLNRASGLSVWIQYCFSLIFPCSAPFFPFGKGFFFLNSVPLFIGSISI